jgi:hypothetical protein
MARTLSLAFLVFAAAAGPAVEAGPLLPDGLDHVRVGVRGVGAGGKGTHYDEQVYAFNSASLLRDGGGFSGTTNTTEASFAQASPFTGSMLRVSAASSSDYDGSFAPEGAAYAFAGYRDVISLVGQGPLPGAIRLVFEFQGTLNAALYGTPETNPQSTAAAFFDAAFLGYEDFDLTFEQGSIRHSVGLTREGSATVDLGFASSSYGNSGAFTGTVVYDAPYDQRLGGYAFNLLAWTRTVAHGGAASADFSHTVSLEAITNTDGSELSGFDPSFASGLQLGPAPPSAPEPGTFALMSLGGLGMAGNWWRRRKAAAVTL